MKKLILCTLIATLNFPLIAKAEDIVIPVISKPDILEEGTQRELSKAQIAELLPWAKNSKIFLVDLLDNVQGLPMSEKVDRLSDGIKKVVVESAPQNSELLMRYTLNRALVIKDTLDREISEGSVSSIDAKSRVLILSINMALKYFDTDMEKLVKQTDSPYASFGIEYFKFLNELNKSIFDASAQYIIQRTSLEWLQWDLYRDLKNAAYASQIVKIDNALKVFPKGNLTDAQSINYIRQVKKVSSQLNILEKPEIPVVKVEEPVVPQKKGKFISLYDSYEGTSYCYPADSNGNRIGNSKADIKNCQTGYVALYSSYDGTSYCYPSNSSNNRLGDSKANISYCQKGYVSLYDSYERTNFCYPASESKNRLGDSAVDIKYCQ